MSDPAPLMSQRTQSHLWAAGLRWLLQQLPEPAPDTQCRIMSEPGRDLHSSLASYCSEYQRGDLVTHWSHSRGILNSLDMANEHRALSLCQGHTKTCCRLERHQAFPKNTRAHPSSSAEPFKSPRCRQDAHGLGRLCFECLKRLVT